MKIKVFTSFSGYDSQCLALEYLGIDYELVGWSEMYKLAGNSIVVDVLYHIFRKLFLNKESENGQLLLNLI